MLELGAFRAEGLPVAPLSQTLQLVLGVFFRNLSLTAGCKVLCYQIPVRRTLRVLNTKSPFPASKQPKKSGHPDDVTNLAVI